MAHIQWKDRYSIGYKDIDDQHKGLLGLLNELVDLRDVHADPERVGTIFHRLCEYALTHFKTEERYMRAAAYPKLAQQEEEHAAFIQQLLQLNQTYDPADPVLVETAIPFLRDWYLTHILHSDLDYAPWLKRYRDEAEIRAVIFDFGNVVAAFDHDRMLEALAPVCGKSASELKEAIFGRSDLFRAYESGALDSQAFLAQVCALCGADITEAVFVRAFTDIFTPIESTQDLIRKLKPHYRLGLLSNTNPWHAESAIRTSPVFPLFDAVTLSFEVGALKPDPILFEDVLDKLDLLAEECIFIDDIPGFAAAADAHLMHGIAYTDPESLIARLRKLKVDL